MSKVLRILAVACVLAAITGPMAAGAPNLINYQGRLTDSSGKPRDGAFDMEFAFYDALAGGTQLATPQVIANVSVSKGVFNVQLAAFPKIFIGRTSVYLQVQVGAEVLAPRQQILTTPYAFAADFADESEVSYYADDADYAAYAANADRVDGYHASAFAAASHNHDSSYVNVSGDTMTGSLEIDDSLLAVTGGLGSLKTGTVARTPIYNQDIASGNNLHADRSLYLGSSDGHGNIYSYDSAGNLVFNFDAGAGELSVGGSNEAGEIKLKDSSAASRITLYGGSGNGLFDGKVTADRGLEGTGTTGTSYLPPLASIPAVPGVRGYGTSGGISRPGAPGVEAVGGGGTLMGSLDLSLRAIGNVQIIDHDNYGVWMYPGDGSTEAALRVYRYGSTGTSQPVISLPAGNMSFGAGYGTTYETSSGNWRIYGSSSNSDLQMYGPNQGRFVLDWANGVIQLGGSTADTVEIPAKIISDSTGVSSATVHAYNNNAGGIALYAGTESTDAATVFVNKGTGDIIRGFSGPTGGTLGFRVTNTGRVITTALQITGGGDLAEPFHVSGNDDVKPGMVMAIDPDNAGQLRVSTKAYDRTVAGVVSGANGINPGVVMKQEGSIADGTQPVALTGRVYCWCDAASGAIQPGDLLTTSATPGHAMKVTDHGRAQGAIIGKAMTRLTEGRGLVLVLVTLQ